MPIYVCFCPDYPDSLDKRIVARPAHLEASKKSGVDGTKVFGRGWISDDYAHSSSKTPKDVPDGPNHPGMSGSVGLYRFKTIEEAWDRIKADPYWSGGVWDKERTTVRELMEGPDDEHMAIS